MSRERDIPVVIEILKVDTGEIAAYYDGNSVSTDSERSNGFNLWMWEEGNFSCDCNREMFWYQAQDLPEPDIEVQCGNRNYLVRITNLEAGEFIYDEISKAGDACPLCRGGILHQHAQVLGPHPESELG